ncbi:MAG: hypothetical protein ACRD2O_07455, partial [Terriglobia bacterium]
HLESDGSIAQHDKSFDFSTPSFATVCFSTLRFFAFGGITGRPRLTFALREFDNELERLIPCEAKWQL